MGTTNIDLLRERLKEISAQWNRAAVLMLAVVALTSYVTSRALRDVETNNLRGRFAEAVTLATVVSNYAVIDRVKAASPARQFFLLSAFVAEPLASFDTANEKETQRMRRDARSILIRYKKAPNDVTGDEPDPTLTTCPIAATPVMVAECAAMYELAWQIAGEVERGYADAFSVSLGAEGAQVPIDMRNWLAIIPPSLVIALCYFYLLAHERAIVHALARNYLTAEPTSLAAERLSFTTSAQRRPLSAYSSSVASALFLVVLAVQLRYLAVTWSALLSSNGADSLAAAGLFGGGILLCYAFTFCRAQSERMDSTVQAETGVMLDHGKLTRFRQSLTRLNDRVVLRRPRAAAIASASLLLLTLALPTAMTSCGPVGGLMLVTQPMRPATILQATSDRTAWWFPAFVINKVDEQAEDWQQSIQRLTLVADQEAGYVAYVALLAAVALWLLLHIAFRIVKRPFDRRISLVIHRIVVVAGLFAAADMAWFFSPALMRAALIGVLFPLSAVALWPGELGRRRAQLRRVVCPVILPAIAGGQVSWVASAILSGGAVSGLALLVTMPAIFSSAIVRADGESRNSAPVAPVSEGSGGGGIVYARI